MKKSNQKKNHKSKKSEEEFKSEYQHEKSTKQTCKFLVAKKKVENAKINEQIDNKSKCSNVEKNLKVRKYLEKKRKSN